MNKRLTKSKILKAKNTIEFLGNKILYELCENHYWHVKNDKIISKVWMIGRCYAVAIERGRDNQHKPTTEFYEKDIPRIFKRSHLDNSLRKLKKIELSNDNLVECLKAHYSFMTKLESNIKLAKGSTNSNKRSFCSKYLHFHLPNLFFIYDSIVSKKINEFITLKDIDTDFKKVLKEKVDKKYAEFFLKCYILTNKIKKTHKINLTPRQLDNLLYFD